MFCKYCNADLKPEDKVCPVCERPLNDEIINSTLNENIVQQPIVENTADSVEEQPIVVEEQVIEIPDDVVNENVSEVKIPEESSIKQTSVDNSVIIESQPSIQENIEPIVQNQSEVQSDIVKENNVISSELQSVVTNNVSNVQNLNVEKKHKNNMWIIFVVFILFLGFVGGFMFYVSRSPKMIFNTLINNTYKRINNSVVTDIKNISGSMSLQTNISTKDESNEIFKILNSIYIGADYEIDYENKQALVKLNTKYDNSELLDADVYLKDSKGYVLLKDVYNKYISTDIEGIDDIFEEVKYNENHKIVIEEVKKALTKSLKSEYFVKEMLDIQINNETISVTKNSLVLNQENINRIEEDVLTILKGNDKFITSLSEITGENKNEILSGIEEELGYISSNSYFSTDEMVISIYTNGLMNDVVKMDLELNNEGEKTIIECTEQSENNYSISMLSGGSIVEGSVKILESTSDKVLVEVSLTEPTSGTTIGVTVSTSIKYNTELTSVNTNNSIDVNNLTEQDQTEIMSKLMERKGIQDLMDAFGGLSLNSPNYDDNYDYELENDIYNDLDYSFDEELVY